MSESGGGGASWRGCGMQCCAPSDPSSTNQEQSSLFPARATHEPLPWHGSRGSTIHPGTNRVRPTRTAAVLRRARTTMRRATCLSRLKSVDVEAAGGVLKRHALLSAPALGAADAKRSRY